MTTFCRIGWHRWRYIPVSQQLYGWWYRGECRRCGQEKP